MKRGNLSRRGFMQRSLAAMAAAGVPAWFARELFESSLLRAAAEEKKPAANDKVRMGSIGNGSPQSRGRAIAGEARKFKEVEYVAVCDVDKSHRERAARELGGDVKQFEDFRELLDRKDIDAVTIAVPDHWHALVYIEALKKGKHVYGEKPLSLTIGEGRAIADAAKKYGKTFQTGSQQRTEFGGKFRLVAEIARSGRLGKIQTIETRIGANPTSPSVPKAPVPDGLNWDFWLGPTPKVDYADLKQSGKEYTRCHYEFRWWYEYSGGKMTDWGAHHNDIAQWSLGMDDSGPVAVEVEKADPPSKEPNSYNCHPNFKVVLTYANGVKLIVTSGGENGIKINGEDGKWVFASRGKIDASDKKILEEPLPAKDRLYYQAGAPVPSHMGNFLECMKSGKPTVCTAEIGHRSATVCHLGNIAIRSGKKLKWDPKAEKFDDAELNKWLIREFRAPWKLEV